MLISDDKVEVKINLHFLWPLIFFCLPGRAEEVCSAAADRPALVIIDMQPHYAKRNGFHTAPENIFKIDQVIASQVAAIEKAKKQNIPIIFVEYTGAGDTADNLKKAVQGYKDVKFFKKNTDGMFDPPNRGRQELVDYLKKNRIGNLIVTGANGGACVRQSILGALKGNCNVVAYSNGIADFNFKEFIYPYKEYYGDVKPNCTDCSFREVHRIIKVEEVMATARNHSNAVIPGEGQEHTGGR